MAEGTTLVDRLVEFGNEMRREGLPVGSDDVLTYCAALATLDPGDIEDLYWSGRATLVNRRDHIPVYDRVFRRFFLGAPEGSAEPEAPERPTSTGLTQGVLQIPDSEPGESETEDSEQPTLGFAASDAEIWREKAFSAISSPPLQTV